MKPLLLALLASAAFSGANAAVIAKANLTYGEAGGKPLQLDLCLPDGSGPYPGVILVHGGGWIAGDKMGDTKPLLAPLTQAGFAWFSINYRLAPASRYPACLDDVYTAIRWVKAHAAEYHVDANRLALVGESAGGYLVEMAALEGGPDTRVNAVVPFFGPSDLLAQTKARGGLKRDLISLFGCTRLDPVTERMLEDASPVNHVHAGLPPFLLLHGTADHVVPYDQSVTFRDRLSAVHVPCELVTIPDGTHAMGNWNHVAPRFKEQFIGWLKTELAAKPQVIAKR